MFQWEGHNINAFIFDMDGTLFNTEQIHYDAWTATEKEFGIGAHQLFSLFAGVNAVSVSDVLTSFLGDRELAQKVQTRHRERLASMRQLDKYRPQFRPGAGELLAFLWEHKICSALATSSLPEKVKRQFSAVGIAPQFDAVVTGDSVTRSKPAPDIFWKAAELIGVPINHCAIIEDSPNGIRGAADSGAYVILTPDVYTTDEMKCLANYITPSLTHLLQKIRTNCSL